MPLIGICIKVSLGPGSCIFCLGTLREHKIPANSSKMRININKRINAFKVQKNRKQMLSRPTDAFNNLPSKYLT